MLNYLKEREITRKVDELLRKHNIDSPPVNLSKILLEENIKYLEENFEEIGLPKNADALIYAKENYKTIIVNEEKHIYKEKKRFTLAHELGHFFLHTNDRPEYLEFRNGNNSDPTKEEEANFFAASLLMPITFVEDAYFNLSQPYVSILARRFNVSLAAMRYRLDFLGLSYINA